MSALENSSSIALLLGVSTFAAVLVRRALLTIAPQLWKTDPRLVGKHDIVLLLLAGSGSLQAAAHVWQVTPVVMQTATVVVVLCSLTALVLLYRASRS